MVNSKVLDERNAERHLYMAKLRDLKKEMGDVKATISRNKRALISMEIEAKVLQEKVKLARFRNNIK